MQNAHSKCDDFWMWCWLEYNRLLSKFPKALLKLKKEKKYLEKEFILKLIAELNKQLSKKSINIDLKSLDDTMYVKVLAKLSEVVTTKELKKQLEQLKDLYIQVGANVQIDDKNSLNKDIENAIKQAQEVANKSGIKLHIDESDITKIDDLINKLKELSATDYLTNTEKSVTAIDDEVKAMLDIVQSAKKAAIEKLEFAKANEEVRESADNTVDAIIRERNAMHSLDDINYILDNVNLNGQQGESVFRRFGNTLQEAFSTYTIANLLEEAIYEVINAGQKGIEVTKELNDVATSLRMATGDSLENTNELVSSYNELGQQLGTITKDVSESADAWLRQGHSIEDTNTLIVDSMMLSKIANLESADSTKYLTSIMQAYNLTASEVVDVVSKLSAVDLESASEAGGLAESLSRCASAAKMAGVSMDTLISYISTVKEITQDSDETIGNMFKSIFSRTNQIRAGKFIDLETGESLNDTEKVLNQIGIATRDMNNQLIDSEQILDSVGRSWKEYDSNTQKALATAIAGTYQYNKFIALMQSYGDAIKYANISANSQGVAEEKFSFYLDSLEAKTNSLQASLEKLATTTISDELYASVLDTSKAIVDLITETGVLKGLLVGLGVSGSIYGFQQLTASLRDITQGFANLNEAMNMTRNGTVGIDDMQRLMDLTGGLSQSQTRLLLSTQNLTDAQKVAILMNQGLSQAEAQQTIQTWGVATAQQGATVATITFTNALRGLWQTLMANPLILVTTLVTAGVMAFQRYNQKLEETKQATKEAADKANILGDEIAELTNKYISLSEKVKINSDVKEDLITTQTELLKKLGLERESIEDLISKYGSLDNAIKQVSLDSLKNSQIDLVAGLKVAKEELLDVGADGFWGTNNVINAIGKDAVKAFKELEKVGLIGSGSYGAGGGSLVLTGDDTTVDGILENYQKLEDALKTLRDSNAFTTEELSNNALYQAIYAKYNEMKDSVEAYNTSIADLNENLAQQIMLSSLQGKEIPKTEEEFDIFKQELIDTAIASKQFIGTEEEIANVINNYLATVPQFQGFYSIPLEKELNAVEDLLDKTSSKLTDKQIETFETYKKNIETISGALSDIHNLETSDIASLITDFAKYGEVFKQFGVDGTKGTGDLKGALEEIARQMKETTKDSVEPLTEAIEDMFNSVLNASKGIKNLSDALSELQDSHDLLKDIREDMEVGGINVSNLQKIIKLYPELSVAVAKYQRKLISEKELYKELEKQYKKSFDALKNSNREVLENSEEFYRDMIKLEAEKFEKSTNMYLKDLKNYTTLAQAKLEIEKKLHSQLETLWNQNAPVDIWGYQANTASNWEEFFTVKQDENGKYYAESTGIAEYVDTRLGAVIASVGDFIPEQYTDRYKNLAHQVSSHVAELNNALLTLDEVFAEFDTDFDFNIKFDGEDSVKKTFDYIEIKLKTLEEKVKEFDETISDTSLGYDERKSALSEKMDFVSNEQITALERAKKEYQKLADAVDLDKDTKTLIREGDFKVDDTITEAVSKQIDEFQKWIDKVEETDTAIDEARKSIQEDYRTMFDLTESEANDKADDLKQEIEELNQALEESAYTGEDTTPIYDSLISKQTELATSYHDSAIALRELVEQMVSMGTLKPNSQEWQQYMSTIEGLANLAGDTKLDIKGTMEESYQAIVEKYDRILSKLEHQSNITQSQLAQSEAQGYIDTTKYQYELLEHAQDRLETNVNKQGELKEKIANLLSQDFGKIDASKLYELQEEYNATTEEIEDCKLSILEIENEIRQIGWDIFDFGQEQIARITDEAEFLIDLMDELDKYDEKGQLTDVGLAIMGQHGLSYNVHLRLAENYAKQLQKIEEDIAKNPADTKLIERKNELLSLYQDSIISANEQKYAIRDMVEEGINFELESLQELIDAYGEALDEQKELYDWQKKTANQTKAISALQKQLAAYENDKSAESRAKVQKIRVQLEEELSNLDDMNREYSISQQKELLSSLYDTYETILNEKLDDVDALFEEMMEKVDDNADIIADTIETETKKVGYTVTDEMDNIWQSTEDKIEDSVGSIVGGLDTELGELESTIKDKVDEVISEITNKNETESQEKGTLQSVVVTLSEKLDGYYKSVESNWTTLFQVLDRIDAHLDNIGLGGNDNTTNNTNDTSSDVVPSKPSTPSAETPSTESEKSPFVPKVGATLSDVTGKWYRASDGGRSGSVDILGANSWKIERINEGAKYPYHLIGYKDGKTAGSGWVDASAFPEYHNGLKSATEDHLGWTQDGDEEVIIRRSDGAILTPLKASDMILNSTATARLWEAMNNPAQFIGDYMPKAQMPDLSAIKGGNVNNVENHFDFNITGVTNLDDLAREIKVNLQHDHKFEKMIQDIVINPLVGGSRLAKYTYNFK